MGLLLIIVLGTVIWWIIEPGIAPIAALLFGSVMVGMFTLMGKVPNIDEVAPIDLDLARERVAQQPDKTKPAWDLATARLETYVSTNLKQINMIFNVSVVVMLIGFLLLVVAVVLAIENSENVTAALVSGIGGAFTELIGATFLALYRSAVQQSGQYLQVLDKTSSVGIAIHILDNIPAGESPETQAKVVEAKIEVAKLLLSQSSSDLVVGEANESR